MSSETSSKVTSLWARIDQLSDKRTKGWPLVDSPLGVALVCLSYLVMVWWAKQFMEKRKPFKINNLFLIVYNLFLVLLSGMIMKDLLLGTSRLGVDFFCYRIFEDYHPEAIKVTNAMWWFLMSKSFEFMDTLLIVLRKKNDQLSTLHVFHHCTVFPITWILVKWTPSGGIVRMAALNCFVHVVMYSYYGLSAMGPKSQRYLWWKKYLTSLQLVQFLISLSWSFHSLLRGCNHHALIDVINVTYMCTMLYLFGKFYQRKYTQRGKIL